MKKISIIIVTWNCKRYIRECLDSLKSHISDRETEVIVVDNASTDGTVELVTEVYPAVKLIRNSANAGFAKANNIGIRESQGDYLCLVNADVRVLEGCIERLTQYIESNPSVGVVGPRMLGPDGKCHRSYMGTPTLWRLFCRALALDVLFPRSKCFGGFLMPYFGQDKTCSVDILNGWFWMIRRKALESVGLLDERFFMYGEDMEWCKRFRDANWKIVYFAEAEALHYGGGSSSQAPIRFAIEMEKANFQYWSKNYGRLSQITYLSIVWLHGVIRLMGYSIATLAGFRRAEAAFKVKKNAASVLWVLGFGGKAGGRVQ